MRTVHLVPIIAAFSVSMASVWLGCSSSSGGNGGTTTDGGKDSSTGQDSEAADSGAASDSGQASDTGTAGDTGSTADGPAVSCTDYCTTILSACSEADGNSGNTAQFYDNTNCMNTCMLWQPGTYGDNGDTVGCRQAQAHAAVADITKCEAAGAGGGGVCGARCDDYCTMVMAHCTVANGANPPYANNADCMSACMAYPYDTMGPDYDPNAISKLNCLDYHLRESLSDLSGQGIAGGHCDDLSIDGGTTRGACHP